MNVHKYFGSQVSPPQPFCLCVLQKESDQGIDFVEINPSKWSLLSVPSHLHNLTLVVSPLFLCERTTVARKKTMLETLVCFWRTQDIIVFSRVLREPGKPHS